MYAIESNALWNKFVATVELLAVIDTTVKGAGVYVQHVALNWVAEDRTQYVETMQSAATLGYCAEQAVHSAARNLLSKDSVETAFALAIESIETTLRGFNFLCEMQCELPGVTKDKKHLLRALEVAQPHR